MGTFKLPGAKYVMELTQFSGVERKPGQPMHTDPGAADLQLRVRDIDPIFAAIKKSGVPIITHSGAPVKIGPPTGNIRSVLVRDPDGYVLEVIQLPAPNDGNAATHRERHGGHGEVLSRDAGLRPHRQDGFRRRQSDSRYGGRSGGR